MITIKHRFSGVTLCEFDVETVKLAVETAVKDGADLLIVIHDIKNSFIIAAGRAIQFRFGRDIVFVAMDALQAFNKIHYIHPFVSVYTYHLHICWAKKLLFLHHCQDF